MGPGKVPGIVVVASAAQGYTTCDTGETPNDAAIITPMLGIADV